MTYAGRADTVMLEIEIFADITGDGRADNVMLETYTVSTDDSLADTVMLEANPILSSR